MNGEQEKLQKIFMGYHPRTQDGSSPQSRSHGESIAVMEAYNKSQGAGDLRAELVEIAFTDLCAVAVVKTTIGKVWQYI